jgi:hypothetical protein
VAQGATATPAGTRTARTPLGLTWEDVFVCRAGAVHSAPTMLAVHPASMRAARGRGRPCARGAACVHRAGCTSDCTQEALGGLAVRRRCHGGLFLIGALAHPGRRCKVLRAADWRVRRSPVTGPDASPAAGPRQPTQCLHRAYTAPTQCPHSAYIAAASSPSTVDRRPSPAAPERLSTARREAPDASQAPPGVHLCPLSAALISRRRGAIASPSLVQAPERKWPAPSGPPRPIIRSRPYPSPASPAVPYRAQPPRLPPRLHPASPTASRQFHQLVHAAFRRADVMLAVSSVLCGASLHNRALTKPSPHRLSCRSFHGPLLVFLDHTPHALRCATTLTSLPDAAARFCFQSALQRKGHRGHWLHPRDYILAHPSLLPREPDPVATDSWPCFRLPLLLLSTKKRPCANSWLATNFCRQSFQGCPHAARDPDRSMHPCIYASGAGVTAPSHS